MRLALSFILIITICASAMAEVQEQQPPTQKKDSSQPAQSSKPSALPVQQQPVIQQPQPVPAVKPTHTPWYKDGSAWIFIGLNAGLAAGGGYLLSRDGTGSKVGGGVMVGVSGILLCTAFVRGCTR